MLLGHSSFTVIIPFVLLIKGFYFTNEQNERAEFKELTWDSREVFLSDNFTIRTPGCTIPSLDYLTPNDKKFVPYPKIIPKCRNSQYPLLLNNQTHIWIVKDNFIKHNLLNGTALRCCYSGVETSERRGSALFGIRAVYGPCLLFNDLVKVRDEFVRVTCNASYEQFFIFTPRKRFTPYRENPFEQAENQIQYNVLILGLSSISRLHFLRTMPNTLNFLKSRGAIEMMGYNKATKDQVLSDAIAMLLGVNESELRRTCWPNTATTYDRCPFIWERFKDVGYYTALIEDSAMLSPFNLNRNGFSGFKFSPTDYYLYPIIKESERVRKKHSLDCMGNKYYFQVMLDYAENLINTLKSRKLFGVFWESAMSRKRLQYPMLFDQGYERLLKKLHSSGYLNETILILMSDQGTKPSSSDTKKHEHLEERLPILYFLPPPSFRKRFSVAYENLKDNAHRLITPYDLYNTLVDLIDLNAIKNDEVVLRSGMPHPNDKKVSLFMQVPSNRTCRSAGISDELCTCFQTKEISNNSAEALDASMQLVHHLNGFLKNYPQCAPLRVQSILEAVELKVPYESNEEWREFTLVIRVEPSGGILGATLRHHKEGDWTLSTSINRLNPLTEQSHCVDPYRLKLYCHCILPLEI